jgi:predicted translin family RNA/ssDNA-binding protein
MASTATGTSHAAANAPAVLNVADFAAIQQQMTEEDERREAVIKRSRDVQKKAKNAIYDLHRGNIDAAWASIAEARGIAKSIIESVAEHPNLRHGALSSCIEELAEAHIFAEFLRSNRIATLAELEIANREEYLGGVMDFSGELNRYAVLQATKRDMQSVTRCREVVDQLMAMLMLFDFRNGALRRKYDTVKYTLKKMEQICYELTLAASTPFVPKSGAEEPPMASSAAADDGEGEGDFPGGTYDDTMQDSQAPGGQRGGGGRGGRGGRGGFAGHKRARTEGEQ